MGQIGRHARGVDNIEERELINERGDLAEKRQGLYDSVIIRASRTIVFTWPMPPEAPSTTALTMVKGRCGVIELHWTIVRKG